MPVGCLATGSISNGWASEYGRAVLPVVTKIDKLSASKRKPALTKIAQNMGLDRRQLVGWSATQGIGLEDLWRRLTTMLNVSEPADEQS